VNDLLQRVNVHEFAFSYQRSAFSSDTSQKLRADG